MPPFKPDISHTRISLSKREWLVTNGIGGFASGTLSGVLTRSYHGLLVSALAPPLGRTVQLVRLEETVWWNGDPLPLFSDHRFGHPLNSGGIQVLESFFLEGAIPVWRYAIGETRLEKRVWMRPGENTTCVRYERIGGTGLMRLTLRALVNHRDFHHLIAGDPRSFSVRLEGEGVAVAPDPDAAPFYLFLPGVEPVIEPAWERGYYHAVEAYRGLDAVGDNLAAALFQVELAPGDAFTFTASTLPEPELDGDRAFAERLVYESNLLRAARIADPDPRFEQLILAADQFIVRRGTAADGQPGYSVIAGYHWFGDWGRDTMIALPGLTLATGRPEIARRILETFALHISVGMLPNRFPDSGEAPEYNTVDATLWYFEAIRAYYAATGDLDLVSTLYPHLADILSWHVRGTRYQIHMDPSDGLIFAGEPGVQLTWMDAKVDDWVVTPRIGKPVEINALWYNALRIMGEFSLLLGRPAAFYNGLAELVQTSFARFWNHERGACFDVIDTPSGEPDASIRPNQLFAVALHYSPLAEAEQRSVVEICREKLLTPHGLRSLAPDEPEYAGQYGGSRRRRDGAYHQGTVWGWLIGPFAAAQYRLDRDADAVRSLLAGLLDQLSDHCIGSLSEIFDGDPPHTSRGCIAQAWTVAEVLRVRQLIETG